MISRDASRLCLECGLCCNGVIFARGELQPEDDARRLESLGLTLLPNRKGAASNRKFKQPCSALDGCRCRIYAERPKYCREFECRLLMNVHSGKTGTDAAMGIIRTARQRVGKVRGLLQQLGDTDESMALGARFGRMKRRMEADSLDARGADLFGQLTLAVHDLNLLLSGEFYSDT